jgi:phosphoglycerate dehydrogenase-like enzyme
MTAKPFVLLATPLHASARGRLAREFPEVEAFDAADKPLLETHLPRATIAFGAIPAALVPRATNLRWIQLNSAGVPLDLCDALRGTGIQLTNLAGLYGPTIAEHTLGLMLMVARNLHRAMRQQQEHRWQRDLRETMVDLAGQTAAIFGVGNIGQHIARLCQAFGMHVRGCRRTPRATPCVDQLFGPTQLRELLTGADFVIVAAPLTRETDGMLGPAEFAAMKPGAFFINISRGKIAQEAALVNALRAGHIAGAGLDVFAVEPLAQDHPFWDMPQVVITPHYSGEIVNLSSQSSDLFLRNLRAFLAGKPVGHVVDVTLGY